MFLLQHKLKRMTLLLEILAKLEVQRFQQQKLIATGMLLLLIIISLLMQAVKVL
jgi:hypothetical protein